MRILTRSLVSALFLSGASVAATAQGSFDLSRGKFPAGTEIVNRNGLLPDKEAYKHGYVETGWTVDRLDNRGYVALSPTYTATDEACDNLLSIPEWKIEKGMSLSWEARSVYRHFPESYRVMAFPSEGGDPVLLLEVGEESYSWKKRAVSLDPVAGLEVRIGFVATSKSGYLLALTGIKAGYEDEPSGNNVSNLSDDEPDEFTRALVVDKATGMWCVNCPEGETVIESLMDKFGKRLIVLNTHVRDALANEPYWEALDWYSVPRMMLNRIRATEGANDKKFADYYDCPTSFGISLARQEGTASEKIGMTAIVKVAQEVDNSADRYRVGYVLTGNFHEADNARYNQKNNCSQPSYGAYYYLPSEIPSALMYYDNVTLSSETAFSGIESSLPVSMIPGATYEVPFEIEVPSLLSSAEEGRVVAFVIDTATGELMNAAIDGEAEGSGMVETVSPSSPLILSIGRDGIVRTGLKSGESFTLAVFSADGVCMMKKIGMAAGNDSFALPHVEGMMIVRLSSSGGSDTVKAFIR